MGRIARPQPRFPDAVGADLARGFARPRPFPPPPAPAGARMAGGRGLRVVRLHRTTRRRLVGGINLSNVRRGVAQAASVGYWMGQPYAGQGLDDRRAARHPAVRVRRAAAAPPRGGLPAAQRALQGRAGQGRLPRGGAGAPVSADQRPVGRPSAVRPAAGRLRSAPEAPVRRGGDADAQSHARHHHPGLRRLRAQRAVGAHARLWWSRSRPPPRLRAREQGDAGRVDGARSMC